MACSYQCCCLMTSFWLIAFYKMKILWWGMMAAGDCLTVPVFRVLRSFLFGLKVLTRTAPVLYSRTWAAAAAVNVMVHVQILIKRYSSESELDEEWTSRCNITCVDCWHYFALFFHNQSWWVATLAFVYTYSGRNDRWASRRQWRALRNKPQSCSRNSLKRR